MLFNDDRGRRGCRRGRRRDRNLRVRSRAALSDGASRPEIIILIICTFIYISNHFLSSNVAKNRVYIQIIKK